MNHSTTNTQLNLRTLRAARTTAGALALLAALCGSGLVQAQTTAAPASDSSLTWNGITLYGIVDAGLQYQTHGVPISDYFPGGSADLVQKNSNKSVFGVTPSNIAQSRVGLQGVEAVMGDWSAVFKLETFFNPQSGELSDALKSLNQNNGRALAAQNTNIDSSVAGQIFQQSYVGFSSPTYGTFTFGRQNTVLADGISKYDPNYASQAFSLIGLSGTAAGGGDTENRRLDSSIKYVASYQKLVHVGAQYKFNQSTGGGNNAVEADIGGEYAGLSVDAYYAKVKDAVAAGALSAAQVVDLPLLAQPVPAGTLPVPGSLGIAPDKALTGTISDNTTFALMGLYNLGAPKLFAGYEHISYANPSTPLTAGFDTIGGYKLAYVNVQSGPESTYFNKKILQVYWAGVRYTVLPELDITGAYYGLHQNAYGSGANAGCTTNKSGTCRGTEDVFSIDADYRLTKRFDAYVGAMYSGVHNGLSNGYLHTTDLNPTVGLRYKF